MKNESIIRKNAQRSTPPKIHSSAVIAKTAQIGRNAAIGANCVIGDDSSIGNDCALEANVVIGPNTKIGDNNHFFPGCAMGQKPQILNLQENSPIGALTIRDNNTFREHVTVHCSMYHDKSTIIGSNNLLMVGTHIGHDCILEDSLVLSNFCQISGHCAIQTGAWLSGLVAAHQFVTIGKWAYVAGMAGINRDVPPFLIASGHYPCKVRGVNRRGLKRAGLDESQQDKIIQAYKELYRGKNKSLIQKAKDMIRQPNLDENIRCLLDSLLKSSQQRFGRYLEQFRY